MADILLTHSNHLYFDPKQVKKMQPYPPLQTLIAAALLREHGFSVAVFDATFTAPAEGFAESIARHRPSLIVVSEDNFNFLTKMCLVRNREVACGYAAAAQSAGIPIVINGSDSSDRVAEYLAAGFDLVLAGELEDALLDVCARGVQQSRGLPGIWWRADDGTERAPARRPAADLDQLPEAAWDLVDMEAYRSAWMRAHGYFALNLVSSRGCPFRCNWCAKPIYGSSYRFRPPQAVAAEMLRLKRDYAPDLIWFADDIFALSRQSTAEFADAVERMDAQVPFKMQSRCDLMTRDTVRHLRRAGCVEVWMGAESGSQRILDAMDKDLSTGDIPKACANLGAHDIRACLFLQFGYPGETWDDIRQTIAMVRAIRPHDIGVSVSYPLPNTPFYDRVRAGASGKTNWNDSGDLDIMFRGTYTAPFYRALADALHLEVRQGAGSATAAWRRVRELEPVSRNRWAALPVLTQVGAA
jgi:radical SAM superfamily enzyme YgiQ (UPF0313 family)